MPNRYPDAVYEDIMYSSTKAEHIRNQGRSVFDIYISRNKNENGLITIVIRDHINGREFGLIEIK